MEPPHKPYLEDIERNGKLASQMINAVSRCDVMVMFPDERAMGSVGELCAAIERKDFTQPHKLIIVVNPFEIARQTIFYAHPGVTRVNNLDDIRKMPWY